MVWRRLFTGVVLLAISAGMVSADGVLSASPPGPEDLEGLEPERVMALVNAWGMDSEENKVTSYLTSREIHVEFPSGPPVVVALPEDRMLVAIAPYIRKTHACGTHYPSSCLGELPNTPARVRAVGADGVVIQDNETYTLANGFVELWLPRNTQVDLMIEARGLKGGALISTAEGAITCVTTLQLHP